jgi:hypothetical protein
MYVDESGDPGYPRSGDFPARGGPTRFFVRAGVVVHGWKWMQVNKMIADFKRSRGLTWDAEIKAKHIRRGKKAFAGWSPSDRKQFLLDLLDSIGREIDVHILVVAIAKDRVDRTRRERFTNPSVRSLEFLLERYNLFLSEQTDRSGIAILDSTESENDEKLRYFQNYLLRFSDHLDPRRIVEGTLFMPSHTTNLLQLADICANVIYGRFARSDGNREEYKRIESRVFAEKIWPP